MIHFKDCVRINGIKPEANFALCQFGQLWDQLLGKWYRCVVTSVADGNHGRSSKHRIGSAFDIRTKHVQSDHRHLVELLLDTFAAALLAERTVKSEHTLIYSGPEFDILWESIGSTNEHIHVEFDAK